MTTSVPYGHVDFLCKFTIQGCCLHIKLFRMEVCCSCYIHQQSDQIIPSGRGECLRVIQILYLGETTGTQTSFVSFNFTISIFLFIEHPITWDEPLFCSGHDCPCVVVVTGFRLSFNGFLLIVLIRTTNCFSLCSWFIYFDYSKSINRCTLSLRLIFLFSSIFLSIVAWLDSFASKLTILSSDEVAI